MKKRSKSASNVKRAKVRGAAEAVLGTDQKGQSSVYDTRSGTLLTIVLLFVLGWIPMIGQMVTGFVGGRRAGSPLRGLVATVVGTITVLLIMFLTVEGIRNVNEAVLADPEGEIAAVAATYPVLQQLLDASLDYVRQLFGSADFTIDYSMYVITIPFGIIGGIFANQAQKETRLTVASTGRVNARSIRSIDAYRDGKFLGFETYEQYTNMSVNSMTAPVSRPVQKQETAPVVVKRVATVRPKETPVTATVDTTRVQSSPTTSVGTVQKKKDNDGEPTVYI